MFDRMIESRDTGAEAARRRRYFAVSSLFVSVMFLTAVIAGIYAEDYSLGNIGFELVQMVAPPEMAAVEPEQRQPQQRPTSSTADETPTRRSNMLRVEEQPVVAPTTVSITKNAGIARPDIPFVISDRDSGAMTQGSGRSSNGGAPAGPSGSLSTSSTSAQPVESSDDPAPPVIKHVAPKPPPQSLGVINGKASYLPKPVYSPAAIAVHAEGKVDVEVTIDETGRVISARAVSGHPLLRPTAEQAARNAKFSPTLLSNVPVKVTGVIVYNFTR